MANQKDFNLQMLVVDILREHNRPMLAREIGDELGETSATITQVLQHLAYDGRVKCISRRKTRQPSLWTAPPKAAATPRYVQTDKSPFTGTDWGASTMRPGCMDHLQHPSRRGDALVPHHDGKMIHVA